MAYTTEQGQRQLLDSLATSAEQAASALAALGEAHELLDEQMAERLEDELFRPVQRAYGRLRRTHAEFASRCGLPDRSFETPPRGAPSHGAKGFVDDATQSVEAADATLAELQDSMLPVEVGDTALRAAISEVRELLSGVQGSARELVRTLGR